MDQLAIQLFHMSGRYMHTMMTAESALPQGQMFVLRYLADHRETPVAPTDLSQTMNVRPPTITPVLQRLEHKGFLARVHSREDRRRVDLSITTAGLAALAEAEKQLLESYHRLLTRLTREEAQELLRLLAKISDTDAFSHYTHQKGIDP